MIVSAHQKDKAWARLLVCRPTSALLLYRRTRQILSWKLSGCPVPPPHIIKQRVLLNYAKRYALRTLIETGTYLGDMVYALKDNFQIIYSIELSETLSQKATARFEKFPHVNILQGDSGEVLPKLLSGLQAPCLFWLDGHFSDGVTAKGTLDTPIVQEVIAILQHSCKTHVILVDDARMFNGSNDYPTMEEFKFLIGKHRRGLNVQVEHDIIRITP